MSTQVDVCLFKQKTAYDVRISDWSSDVCSSDLLLSSRNEFIIFRPKGNRTWQPDLDWTLAPTALAGVCLMGTRSETSACESSRMDAIPNPARRWRSTGATRAQCAGVGTVMCGAGPPCCMQDRKSPRLNSGH